MPTAAREARAPAAASAPAGADRGRAQRREGTATAGRGRAECNACSAMGQFSIHAARRFYVYRPALWQTCAFAYGIDLAIVRTFHRPALHARAAAQPFHLVHFAGVGNRHRARHHGADYRAVGDERFSARSAHAHPERRFAHPDLGRRQHARRLARRRGRSARAKRAGGRGRPLCVGAGSAVERQHGARRVHPRHYSRCRRKGRRSRAST